MRGVALVPLFGLACVTTSVARLSSTKFEARPAQTSISVYSAEQPTCAFTEIAIVKARRETWMVSHDAALDALRSKARKLGGDAVVKIAFDDSDAITGTVIRFDQEDCRH